MENLEVKTIDQVLREGNSITNQNIKDKFVNQHVYCNVGSLVEPFISSYEIDNAPFTMDDIENMFTYPEFQGKHVNFEGGTEEDRDNEIERLRDLQSDLYDQIELNPEKEDEIELQRDEIEEDINELENMETEMQESLEWWAVSLFLYEKLQALEHPVIDAGSCYVWGRCTSGQAILLDHAITQICANMGILEGQKNSWA